MKVLLKTRWQPSQRSTIQLPICVIWEARCAWGVWSVFQEDFLGPLWLTVLRRAPAYNFYTSCLPGLQAGGWKPVIAVIVWSANTDAVFQSAGILPLLTVTRNKPKNSVVFHIHCRDHPATHTIFITNAGYLENPMKVKHSRDYFNLLTGPEVNSSYTSDLLELYCESI